MGGNDRELSFERFNEIEADRRKMRIMSKSEDSNKTVVSEKTSKGKLAVVASKTTEVAKAGSERAKEGIGLVKKGAGLAAKSIAKMAGAVANTGKDAQKRVLKYVDKKKNAKFLETKLKSFEDGVKEGKIEAVDYIKKYANFCLATTALSFFFARCDGDISEEEQLEIQFDLDAIIKNKDLPQEIRNKLAEISLNRDLKFDEVAKYLDGVSVDTVLEFQRDIDEIIFADGIVNESEKEAKAEFDDYLKRRLEA